MHPYREPPAPLPRPKRTWWRRFRCYWDVHVIESPGYRVLSTLKVDYGHIIYVWGDEVRCRACGREGAQLIDGSYNWGRNLRRELPEWMV